MHRVAVGEHLLGQVLDGLGRPFDGSPPAEPAAWYPVYRDAPPPMSRRLIERPLSLGVRAIDGLLTCGEGQRMAFSLPPAAARAPCWPAWCAMPRWM